MKTAGSFSRHFSQPCLSPAPLTFLNRGTWVKSGQGSNALGLDAHHAATLDLPSRLLPTTQSATSPSRGNRLHTALQMWLQLSLHHVVTHITSTASLSPPLSPSSFPTYFSFETQRKSSTLHGLFPDAPLPSGSLVNSVTRHSQSGLLSLWHWEQTQRTQGFPWWNLRSVWVRPGRS